MTHNYPPRPIESTHWQDPSAIYRPAPLGGDWGRGIGVASSGRVAQIDVFLKIFLPVRLAFV